MVSPGSCFQAELVWLPCNPAGYQACHRPARHWRDALLYVLLFCACLAATLCLQQSTHPGPASVTTAAPGGTQDLPAPMLAHLGLGDTFCEALSVPPMDMDVTGDDLILGWDCSSSHDLRLKGFFT